MVHRWGKTRSKKKKRGKKTKCCEKKREGFIFPSPLSLSLCIFSILFFYALVSGSKWVWGVFVFLQRSFENFVVPKLRIRGQCCSLFVVERERERERGSLSAPTKKNCLVAKNYNNIYYQVKYIYIYIWNGSASNAFFCYYCVHNVLLAQMKKGHQYLYGHVESSVSEEPGELLVPKRTQIKSALLDLFFLLEACPKHQRLHIQESEAMDQKKGITHTHTHKFASFLILGCSSSSSSLCFVCPVFFFFFLDVLKKYEINLMIYMYVHAYINYIPGLFVGTYRYIYIYIYIIY